MTRTLADYRPQHDDDCLLRRCTAKVRGQCGFQPHYPWHHDKRSSHYHVFQGPPCTCGLDALILAVRAESRWQPIASAPKDGKPVLLWCTHLDGRGGRVETGSWHDTYGGSWWDSGLEYTFDDPTHWMPLPSSPTERPELTETYFNAVAEEIERALDEIDRASFIVDYAVIKRGAGGMGAVVELSTAKHAILFIRRALREIGRVSVPVSEATEKEKDFARCVEPQPSISSPDQRDDHSGNSRQEK